MKYKLFLALGFITPTIFFGLIVHRIIELDKSLILVTGTMKTFKSSSGGARSSRDNTFTLEEYSAVFKRSYDGWARINVKDRSNDLIGKRPVYEIDNWRPYTELKPKKERQVSFYVAATEWPPSKNLKQPITYFDLEFKKDNRSQVLHDLDLFSYISQNENGMGYIFISLLTTMLFLALSDPVYNGNRPVEIYAIIIVMIHLILLVF